MTPQEQAAALRDAVLAYLNDSGAAARSMMVSEIQPPRPETLYKALDYLATTQQVYVDTTTGSKDPTYYRNGRLAHPVGQRVIDCGRNQYIIRAYEDRLAGRTLTITQYAILPSGESKPVGGIRLDWVDLPALTEQLADAARRLTETKSVFDAGGSVSS